MGGEPFNKIIHERVRLRILTFLARATGYKAAFSLVQAELELSGGNLSIQVKKLEEAGYIKVEKSFVDRKPLTTLYLIKKGTKALDEYLAHMEALILELKGNKMTSKKNIEEKTRKKS